MSLVAVVKRTGDRPGELPETRVVPVGMAQDIDFSAYFQPAGASLAALAPTAAPAPLQYRRARMSKRSAFFDSSGSAEARCDMDVLREQVSVTPPGGNLIDMAAMLEPDGGMPGDAMEVRIARTIALLLAFLAEGHTLALGAFRRHVRRLLEFLNSLNLSGNEAQLLQRARRAASHGEVLSGPWLALARDSGTGWKDLAVALTGK
jgi:hypothetical protein